jgi:hypothetical protein
MIHLHTLLTVLLGIPIFLSAKNPYGKREPTPLLFFLSYAILTLEILSALSFYVHAWFFISPRKLDMWLLGAVALESLVNLFFLVLSLLVVQIILKSRKRKRESEVIDI